MKTFLTVLVVFITLTSTAQHTFSIVAVDPATGEIGSAGATCISAEDGALAISDIVLQTGAIHTQSYYLVANQNNARLRMEAGDSPQEIIDWLVANDFQGNPSQRQYGVVDLNNGNPRSAAYTGSNCLAEFKHISGPNYAIQGNILLSEDVVDDMETAFLNTTGTLADKLMAALQGAKRPGADSRCLDFGISSASAFIRVADPNDTSSAYGDLSLDLNVWIDGVIFEPIDELQDLYNATLSNPENDRSEYRISIYPNPTNSALHIETSTNLFTGYEISDINGKIIQKKEVKFQKNHLLLYVQSFSEGIYFISLFNKDNHVDTERFIVKK